MASTSTPDIERVKRDIEELGYFFQEDQLIGSRADRHRRTSFLTVEGLKCCKTNTFDNSVVSRTVKTIFPRSSLGACAVFDERLSDRISCLITHPGAPEALIVQLWGTNSKVEFYKGSHRKSLRSISGSPLQIPNEQLSMDSKVTEEMKVGGLAILDSRTCFRIANGFAINYIFAIPARLERFAQIPRSISVELQEILENMGDEQIGVNLGP